jgi:hypothetical protein
MQGWSPDFISTLTEQAVDVADRRDRAGGVRRCAAPCASWRRREYSRNLSGATPAPRHVAGRPGSTIV